MPGKGYSRMFENLVSGRRLSPVSAYIAITSDCTYNCWHCSYKNRTGEELSLNQIKDLIDQLVDIGVSIIGLTGGEPTLRNDLVDIVLKASSVSDCMLFTNGVNFNDSLARKLKSAGLWAVAVSLDSHIPEVHNTKRSNPEAFNKAVEAIKISKKYSFYTMLTTVPDIEMLKNKTYKEIYKLASSLDIDEYRIVEPMPTGKLILEDGCFPDENLKNRLKLFHREINQRNLKPKVCSFAMVESGKYFGCCAGTMHLFIDSYGNVCPCDFTPLSFGNIKDMRLSECWERLNNSFKLPRYNCFIQENYELIREYYDGMLPVPYHNVLKIFEKVPESNLPDYFSHVLARKTEK